MSGRRLGWDPWRALRERPHIVFRLHELPDELEGGLYRRRRNRAALVVDDRLSQRERLEALAHELIHDEFGGGCVVEGMPAQWAAIADRLERRIDYEAARRLVPLDRLAELVDALVTMGLPVEVWDVANQFDVTDAVARRALELLAG